MERRRKMGRLLLLAAIAVSLALSAVLTSAAPTKTTYAFDTPVLPGTKSTLLLDNPDRGLRLELYLDVGRGTGVYEQQNKDAFECLRNEIAYYKDDSPKLAQVYFYLTEYAEKDIDQAGFDRMTRYFEILKENEIKAVLRFTYGYTLKEEGKGIAGGGPSGDVQATMESMFNHLEQLKPWIEKHQTQIHVMQLGLVGHWGEWGGNPPAWGIVNTNKNKPLIEKMLSVIPRDMQLQVRYHYIKHGNSNYANCASLDGYDRIGFHDDQLRSGLDGTGVTGSTNPDSSVWKQQVAECAHLLIDGEMFWGGANDDDTNAMSIAQQLQEFYFTSLSLKHNYREQNKNAGVAGIYSMENWKRQVITRNDLDNAVYALKKGIINPLRYAPGWFENESGNNINRNMFEYIRDHLGYYMQVRNAGAAVNGDQVNVTLDMTNYGFSAPHALKEVQVVLLNAAGEVQSTAKICELDDFQPGVTIPVDVQLQLPQDGRVYQVGVRLLAKDGVTGARLANDIAFDNGINILGRLN